MGPPFTNTSLDLILFKAFSPNDAGCRGWTCGSYITIQVKKPFRCWFRWMVEFSLHRLILLICIFSYLHPSVFSFLIWFFNWLSFISFATYRSFSALFNLLLLCSDFIFLFGIQYSSCLVSLFQIASKISFVADDSSSIISSSSSENIFVEVDGWRGIPHSFPMFPEKTIKIHEFKRSDTSRQTN